MALTLSERIQIVVLSFLGAGACVLLTNSTPAVAQTAQALPYVHLQGTTPGTAQSGHANLTGTIKASAFQGNGAGVSGIDAGNLSSGTLADVRLSGNIPRLNSSNSFAGVNNFGNTLNSFAGDGQLLTNLNASNLGAGTVADARLNVGGDLTGPLSNSTVARIRGRSVSATAPTDGQVLKCFGSTWFPSTDEGLVLPFGDTVNSVGTAFYVKNDGARAIWGAAVDETAVYGQVGNTTVVSNGYGVLGSSTLAGKSGVRGHGVGSASGGTFFTSANEVEVAGATRCMTISGSIYREVSTNSYRAVVPLAYGVVSGVGVVQSGTGNFTVTKGPTGVYDIAVTGEAYNNTTHVVSVTAISNSPRFASVADSGSAFRVNMWTNAGVLTDLAFQFTIWGQPASGN